MIDAKYRDEAELVSRGHKGFTVSLKGGGMVSGYHLSDEELGAYIDAGVPVIDKLSMPEERAASLSASMPMCNSSRMDLPPFSGTSYATPDVLADLWSRAGAKVYNVSGYAFSKEMFRELSNREAAILMGWARGNEELVTEAVMSTETRDEVSEALAIPVSDKFQKIVDAVVAKYREAEAEYHAVQEERKTIPFTEWRDHYPNYEDLEPGARMNMYSGLLPKLIYEGNLVHTGQKDEGDALSDAAIYLKERWKETGKGLTPERHGSALAAYKKVSKLVKAIEGAHMKPIDTLDM